MFTTTLYSELVNDSTSRKQHGGKRPGAGRKPSVPLETVLKLRFVDCDSWTVKMEIHDVAALVGLCPRRVFKMIQNARSTLGIPVGLRMPREEREMERASR